MLIPSKQDAVHKGWLLRLLAAICKDVRLSQALGFKGGTCAAMRGFLHRYSVDLDFDFLMDEGEVPAIRERLESIFAKEGLKIQDRSAIAPQYFLKYPTESGLGRNTIKVDTNFPVPKANKYEMVRLPEIDRVMKCQTLETMVANKAIAMIGRYEKNGKIAGRDLFDLHCFFMNGYAYNSEIIFEIRKMSPLVFFRELIVFIDAHVTQRLIDEDLNYLLPNEDFQRIRKILKNETLMLLRDEVKRLEREV